MTTNSTAPTTTPAPTADTTVRRTTRRPFPLPSEEAFVKDVFTGKTVVAEYRHEKMHTKGKGDRFRVYHPLFGTQGSRWVPRSNFQIIGIAASAEDAEKHAKQREDGKTVFEE